VDVEEERQARREAIDVETRASAASVAQAVGRGEGQLWTAVEPASRM
jgi:hypothetical protein